MSVDWLAPVRAALDSIDSHIIVFFRDDDAGWADNQLYALLDCFTNLNMPIDLAVIPQAIDHRLAETLLDRRLHNPAILGLHQHGYAHNNHEVAGRKCEFGPSRNYENQYGDVLAGKMHLDTLLESALDNIFTPPWNRCTNDTASCLINLGFNALSRDLTATPFKLNNLVELPVGVDWCGIRARFAEPWSALASAIAVRMLQAKTQPIGIMLHHAVMDSEDLNHLQALLHLFSKHRLVKNQLMRECLKIW